MTQEQQEFMTRLRELYAAGDYNAIWDMVRADQRRIEFLLPRGERIEYGAIAKWASILADCEKMRQNTEPPRSESEPGNTE